MIKKFNQTRSFASILRENKNLRPSFKSARVWYKKEGFFHPATAHL